MSAEVVPLRPGDTAEIVDIYTPLSQAAREAHAALRGYQSRLDRIFGGNFTTATAKAEIQRLTEEIRIMANAVYRLTR